MSVVEYKLIFVPNVGGTIPTSIKNGGYLHDTHRDTLIGWSDTIFTSEIQLAEIVVLTRSGLVERQLKNHHAQPFFKNNNILPSDPNITEDPDPVLMTDEEVIEETKAWYDSFIEENYKEATTEEELTKQKNSVMEKAFVCLEKNIDNSVANVFISSANSYVLFGCDKVTQENIMGINIAIARGVAIPDPVLWTPKTYINPIEVTHDELADIGGSIFNKKNEMYNVYFQHKSNILSSNNSLWIEQYDYSENY